MTDALQRAPLFAGFDAGEIETFLSAAKAHSVPPGHTFFRMGDKNEALWILRSGQVRVSRPGTSGDVELAVFKTGETFGEMSLLGEGRTTATLTAQEPTEVLALAGDAIERLLTDHPVLAAKFWRNLAHALQARLARTNLLLDHYVDLTEVMRESPDLSKAYYGGT